METKSDELALKRREEIINACEKLYGTMTFKDITIKEIGKETSFSRTSIYNYFQTKEEIFLALMKREYEKWIDSLNEIYSKNDILIGNELASLIANSLEERHNLLKLLSMNLYDIEENSSIERLVDFKKCYKTAILSLGNIVDKFCKYMDEEEKHDFIYSFLPFMFGIYPYVYITDKQKTAMETAGIDFPQPTVYELAYKFLEKFLK